MTTPSNIINLRKLYMNNCSSEFISRIHACKRTALTYIYSYIENLFSKLIPCDNNEHLPWNEALSHACRQGISYIDIPISDLKETVPCDEDNVHILHGNYIMDRKFMEPKYIGGAPTLQGIILTILGEGFSVEINNTEKYIRISIQVL